MQIVLILAAVFVAYELVTQRQVISALTGSAPGTVASSGGSSTPLPAYQIVQGSGGLSSSQTAEWQGVQASNQALNFVPVVGPALSAAASAITSVLMAASKKRAAQATSENSAVAAAIPGWDKAVNQIIAAYNAGQISATEVESFLACPQSNDSSVVSGQGLLWVNFWNECGPRVQPGRNGCKSGAVVQASTATFCGGTTYGASCCVAYDDLKNSCVNMLRAVNQAETSPGSAQSAKVLSIFASKYGGINRPGYTVTFQKPTPVASVGSLFNL
jgi:hypothetical protein